MSPDSTAPIERIKVSAFTIPTDAPESDGTLAWNSTTLVLVEAQAGGSTGIGYSYANTATYPGGTYGGNGVNNSLVTYTATMP